MTLVSLVDVEFRYPAAERRTRPFALTGVTLDIAAGEVLGVIGPNSAGKTTLVCLLTKVLPPQRGQIKSL
mgnify:CR=1 FL=1